jgi:hypothetical protein
MIIIAGRTDTFGALGSLALKMPIELYSNPHEVKPLTGEPDAGDPHVRFGGRGSANQYAIPTPIVFSIHSGCRIKSGMTAKRSSWTDTSVVRHK